MHVYDYNDIPISNIITRKHRLLGNKHFLFYLAACSHRLSCPACQEHPRIAWAQFLPLFQLLSNCCYCSNPAHEDNCNMHINTYTHTITTWSLHSYTEKSKGVLPLGTVPSPHNCPPSPQLFVTLLASYNSCSSIK